MGRRAAPQPLRLSDPSAASNFAASSSFSPPVASSSTSASVATPANAGAHNHNDSHDHNRDHGLNSSKSISSTDATASASPVDSRSARSSPRVSPFTSRFNTRRPHTSRATADELRDRDKLQSDPHHQHPLPLSDRAEGSFSSVSNGAQPRPTTSTTTQAPPRSATRQLEGARLQKAPTEHRKFSKSGFFHFAKSSKASNQLPPPATSSNDLRNNRSQAKPQEDPDSSSRQTDDTTAGDYPVQPVPSHPSTSELSVSSAGDRDPNASPLSARKAKPKPFGLLGRTKSIRDRDYNNHKEQPAPPIPTNYIATESQQGHSSGAPMTAPPAGPERSFRDMMNSTVRNRSEDRALHQDAASHNGNGLRDRERELKQSSSATRENGSGGSHFFSGLRSSSTKAADMISKGLFGKSNTRSGLASHSEPVIDDEHYELKVINLPLVEQTRKTRISKRLETSRDKTEFWMPAFPWRAIDYLNYKGCEVEGLYRVPGSGPQIKRWQRKFDEEHDVNLFEAEDLYDINIIGSMLKAWLRELPDELFPKAAQERVSRECAGAEEVPQLLIDELSNLSPFNYYLLFAITCHLSLLLAHSEKNKMDFRNLCICFQPCMKIDAFSFKFLVCNWRECWKGCKQEPQYIEEEYKLFDQPPPRGLAGPQQPSHTGGEDKTLTKERSGSDIEADDEFHETTERPEQVGVDLSSSASSKQSYQSANEKASKPAKKKPLPLSMSKASVDSNASSISSNLTSGSDQRDHVRIANEMRPLSPIKPLSPIGF